MIRSSPSDSRQIADSSSLPIEHQDVDLDWLPGPSESTSLDERIEEARERATTLGRIVPAEHRMGIVLAAPHQTTSEARYCHEANQGKSDLIEAITFSEVEPLGWQGAPCWRRGYKCYRFEQRILKL